MPTEQEQIIVDAEKARNAIEYSKEEIEENDRDRLDMLHARNQKQAKYTELDDMDYDTWYFKARKAANSYIKPKLNAEDVQVVTGVTREKVGTLVNTLLNFNLEADVIAYDEENETAEEIGRLMTKLVKKSRSLEEPRYDVKRPLVYQELVSQGNVFVREAWEEFEIPDKEIDWSSIGEDNDLSRLKFKEGIASYYSRCNSRMLTGLEMFPGNIRQYYMELQPFIVTRVVLSYAEAKAMFGKWKRFKAVGDRLKETVVLSANRADGNSENTYDNYQMIATEGGFVEVVEIMRKFENTYQIRLNGTPMLKPGFPLSALSGVCEYPISKGDGEPISANFFFSRGIGAKTRMDQSIMDEMFKGAILSDRLGRKPPMTDMGNYNLGQSVYTPGKIFKNVNPDKLKPIGEHQGVTSAQMQMLEYVKQVIDGKTIDPIMGGHAPDKQSTRGQVMLQQQQSLVNLGMIMLGVLNLENRMAWLRIYNIVKNWTEPIDSRMAKFGEGLKEVNKYRSVSMDDTFENGQKGTTSVQFTDDVPDPAQVMAEEDLIKLLKNKNVRKIYIDPKQLKSMKYTWEVNVIPTEKSTNLLKASMFQEFIAQVMSTFAPAGKMPNMDYLADRHARLNDENPEQIYQQAPQQQMGMPLAAQPGMPNRGAQMQPQALPRPSINTLGNQ